MLILYGVNPSEQLNTEDLCRCNLKRFIVSVRNGNRNLIHHSYNVTILSDPCFIEILLYSENCI